MADLINDSISAEVRFASSQGSHFRRWVRLASTKLYSSSLCFRPSSCSSTFLLAFMNTPNTNFLLTHAACDVAAEPITRPYQQLNDSLDCNTGHYSQDTCAPELDTGPKYRQD